jgi:hypothetical protein
MRWSNLSLKLGNGLIYPLNFAKLAKSPHRAVLGGGFATVTTVFGTVTAVFPFLFIYFV